jgi:hypothetical protein
MGLQAKLDRPYSADAATRDVKFRMSCMWGKGAGLFGFTKPRKPLIGRFFALAGWGRFSKVFLGRATSSTSGAMTG